MSSCLNKGKSRRSKIQNDAHPIVSPVCIFFPFESGYPLAGRSIFHREQGSGRRAEPSAHCPLSTVHCPLPSVHCPLPSVLCPRSSPSCPSRFPHHSSFISHPFPSLHTSLSLSPFRPNLCRRQVQLPNYMHRKEKMLGIVPQRDKPVLDVEPAGGLINGIDLNSPDADVLGDVRGSAQSVDQKVFSILPGPGPGRNDPRQAARAGRPGCRSSAVFLPDLAAMRRN